MKPVQTCITVLIASTALYTVSCAPGLLWQDSGVIQHRILNNDIQGGLGLALSHPLFYLIAIAVKYLPFGQFPYKVNLISSIAAAIAVANLFLLVRLWLGRDLPAVIAAVTFALSHTFWRHAAIIETYTLYTAFLTVELIMLLQYTRTRRISWLCWLGLLNGLAVSVHMLACIPLACYAVYILAQWLKRRVRLINIVIIGLLWIIGALPYEFLIVRHWLQTGDLAATLASAAFGTRWQGDVLNASLSLRLLRENLLFILLNFPTPNLLLLPVGLFAVSARKGRLNTAVSQSRPFGIFLLALTALFLAFAFRYTIVDRYAFFIPFYCLTSVLIAAGIMYLRILPSPSWLSYAVLCLAFLPIPAYYLAPAMTEKYNVKIGTKRRIPYRNDYEYFLRPWKTGCDSADRFAWEALNSARPNAVIYADGTTAYPLLVKQATDNLRTDVTVVAAHGAIDNMAEYGPDNIETLFDERPIYAVSPVKAYCPDFLLNRFTFEPAGVLYRAAEPNP